VTADKPIRAAAIRALIRGQRSRAYLSRVIGRYPVLLTAEGDACLTKRFGTAKKPGDRYAPSLWYMLDLLRRCARDGAGVVLAATAEAAPSIDLGYLLLAVANPSDIRKVLRKRPLLLREESVVELERMIEVAAGHDDPRAMWWRHLPWVLRACRDHGTDATIPEVEWDPTGGVRHRREELRELWQRTLDMAVGLDEGAGHYQPALDGLILGYLAVINAPEFNGEDAAARAMVLSYASVPAGLRGTASGQLEDLRASVDLAGQAARIADPASKAFAVAAGSEAVALVTLAEATVDPADAEAAVAAAARAVEAARDHPAVAYRPQAALADALRARYAVTGSLADLRAAADSARQALVIASPWRWDWAPSMIRLAPVRIECARACGDQDALVEIAGELGASMQLISARPLRRQILEQLRDVQASLTQVDGTRGAGA
jgi:hypothetical protein